MAHPTRRSFLQASAAAAAAATTSCSLDALRVAAPVHGQGSPLRVGVVGIGGRGSGAAVQAMRAHADNVLVAVGDAFADRLEQGLDAVVEELTATGHQARVQVPPERRFVGLDAVDQVLASGVDAVVLASPPGFRPREIERAVAAGVHVFAEKPIATDAPGVRRVMAACELARAKGVSIVSGLCYRYHDGRRAIVRRLHDGAIGDVVAMQGNYVTGELWSFPREPQWTELQWQLRNWLYYPWLSGDLIAEQHIHTLDVMAWIKRGVYPAAAMSLGGRQKRTDPMFGTVYDHFATVYEWADGTRGFSYCRQQNDCARDVNEYVIGTEGRANVFQHTITGKRPWRHEGPVRDMYQAEHDEMFAALHGGMRVDDGEHMCNSTLMALMGRMAAYTGQRITWEQALASQEALMPERLRWDDAPPASAVAIPGITKFS
jgi:myo-inositol 2-dehydrogenase / D-chiro-inositol 1-dehydrogenase